MEKESELYNSVYREMSEIVGLDATLKIYLRFKGQQVSFPVRLYNPHMIQNKILKEYDGTNISELARKYLSDLHPESCNSIRVFTYNSGTNIRFLCAWLKAGTGNAIVDNGGAGGVVASLNMETGIVDYDAANEAGGSFKCHPDTGIPFKGFKIEDWEGLKQLAKEAAEAFPTVKLIAWDIAHGEKGWQLIEGNSQGQMWIYQLSSGRGMRKEMEELIGW